MARNGTRQNEIKPYILLKVNEKYLPLRRKAVTIWGGMFKKLTAAVADRSGIQPCVRPFRFYEIDKGIGLTQRGKTAHRASIATKFTSSAGTAGRVAAAPALLLG